MWLIDFLPDFLVHLLVLLGGVGVIAGFVLGMIPLVGKYKLPIQIISILVLALGVYLEGGLSNEKEWRIKVSELEAKLAKSRENAANINTKIVTEVLTKKQYIREKTDKVGQFIDREVTKFDKTCVIPKVVISAHDAAATNSLVNEVDPSKLDAAAKTPIRLPPR